MGEWKTAEWKDLLVDGTVMWSGPVHDVDRPEGVAATEREAQRLRSEPGYSESGPYTVSVSADTVLADGGRRAKDEEVRSE
ncbi:hypothetical protein MUG78_17865 [Gordonia alkaliphila]|uniref:hypothetical protein n=1 Tax=Gordonia alkaliphila TaxID=1053547 RepID=UPI001FF3522D|nr:hypothetical protein [Gordonia alkaliphila]MCK0441269.1 hypothetical protein [Gordonia alkaliphila]